jgi:hypothetical protein
MTVDENLFKKFDPLVNGIADQITELIEGPEFAQTKSGLRP